MFCVLDSLRGFPNTLKCKEFFSKNLSKGILQVSRCLTESYELLIFPSIIVFGTAIVYRMIKITQKSGVVNLLEVLDLSQHY